MSAVATSILGRAGRLARIRQSGLFAGLGYAITVTFGLITGWAISDFISKALRSGPIVALKEESFFFLVMMVHQLPTVPLLTIAVNRAPASGRWRYVWLVSAGIAMWAFCTAFFALEDDDAGANLIYGLMVAMIVAACAYRSSARTATSTLMQRQIESAGLDATVKRARLELLRAQIEPHFLFNTLATVRTLARIDRLAAVDMLDNLMRYLSEALPKLRQEESSLADELQLVDAYLRIHQIRMGTRLSYELLIPEQLGNERIPTMILLTLVENAIKHGINPSIDGGSIRVSASRDHSALVLKVADSGRGLAATDGHGMGLANIRRRLTMLYGDGADLSLARLATRGVVATVSIPVAGAA